MEERNISKNDRLYKVLIGLCSLIAIVLASFLYGLSLIDIVRNTIIICILVIALIASLELDQDADRILYQNGNSLFRFFVSYLFFLVIVCVFALIPETGWVYLPIFVTLTLFSGVNSGFLGGVVLLCFPMLITMSGNSGILFLEYGVPGLIGTLLFATIDEEFKVFRPLFISVMFQFLTLSVFNVLTVNKSFSINLLIFPIINTLGCIAIILFVLKIFSFSFIYKSKDRYMDIIDPDFELLARLKEGSLEDYEHSVYTAVLCSKLSNKLGLDEQLSKACGYYHRIGVLRGDNNFKNASLLLEEYDIPEKVTELLKEYLDPDTAIKSKEVVVLLFSDAIISSVRYLFKKDKGTKIDYAKLIEAVFEKKLSGGMIADSKITFEEINIMKNALIDEKLFYEFLK